MFHAFLHKSWKRQSIRNFVHFDASTASLLITHIKVWSHYLFNVRFFQVYACLLSWAQNRKIWCRARNFLEGQINELVENNIWFFLNDNAIDNEKHQCSRSIWMPLENHNQNVFLFEMGNCWEVNILNMSRMWLERLFCCNQFLKILLLYYLGKILK